MNNNPHTTYTAPDSKRQYRVTGIGLHELGWFTAIQFLDTKEYKKLIYNQNDKVIKIE